MKNLELKKTPELVAIVAKRIKFPEDYFASEYECMTAEILRDSMDEREQCLFAVWLESHSIRKFASYFGISVSSAWRVLTPVLEKSKRLIAEWKRKHEDDD